MKSQLDKQKFAPLTDEQMNQISGGDWTIICTGHSITPDGNQLVTHFIKQYTFLGLKIGEPQAMPNQSDGTYNGALLECPVKS